MDSPRVKTGWSYNPETIEMLNELVDTYKSEAPSYFDLSPRLVVEAILQHAHRENLSFADLFQVPQEAAK